MLGHAPLSRLPLSTLPGASAPATADESITQYFESEVEYFETPEVNGDVSGYSFYADAPLSDNDDVVTSHESFTDSADEPEWSDEALYPSYWAQPPPDDVFDPPAFDDPYDYDDQDEPFGFTDTPLSVVVLQDQIWAEDAPQLEDEVEDYGITDGQVPSDDLPQQSIYEDGQYSDPEDEPFVFDDAQVPADDLPQQALTEDGQYSDPEDEPFDFYDSPLSADVAPDQIWAEDGSNQLEEYLDEDFGFSDGQIPDDVIPAPDQIYPELGDNQLEDFDEPYDFYDGQIPDDVVSTQPGGGGQLTRYRKTYNLRPKYLREAFEIRREEEFLATFQERIEELAGIVESPAETRQERKEQKAAEIKLLSNVNALAKSYSVELKSIESARQLIEQRMADMRNEEALAIILIAANT